MHFFRSAATTLRRTFLPARLLAAATLFAFAGLAAAQSATTGAIGGTVTDTNGARLPGTVVTVTSAAGGAPRTAKANSSGEFTIQELEPGTYTASFTADGFRTYEETSIIVTVGSLAPLQPKLAVGAVTDKVEVTDETPELHTQDNAVSTTIDNATIDNLPINGRRWSDFARLTPGVVSNGDGFGLLSFRGISFLLNNNTVDGADDNQAYFGEARGRTRLAYTITPAAVQEFQVNTSNYSAQYGRAAGGVVNTVTKSGSNQFHGQLFFYDRDNGLGGATNPYTLLTVQQPDGSYNSVPTKPKDWRKEWGFGFGGPLIKDKLFFFYAYDQQRRNYPAISRPTDPNDMFAPSNATLPANETCSTSAFTSTTLTLRTEGDYNACEIAALYGVPFQAGSAYYTQGLGIVSSLIGYVPRRQDQVINLPKLDYQINERNRVSLLYNRMRYSAPNGLYSQTTTNNGRSSFGTDAVKEDFGIARVTSVLTNSMVNEALVQYGRDFEQTKQNAPSPNEVPLANNQFGAAPSTQIGYYFNSGFYDGANINLPRNAVPDERRLQLLDGLTLSKGKHTAKVGLEFNKVSDYVDNLYNGNGSYSYDYSYTFIADYLNYTTGVGGPNYPQQWYSFSQSFGRSKALITTREYAGYATDDWRITPNLTLTLGVRYEYEYIPSNPTPNLDPSLNTGVLHINPYSKPDDRNNIGPRAGFAWNVFGDGKTTLRGGYGLYYGRIINSNILQTYQESGGVNAQTNYSNIHPAGGCIKFPNIATQASTISSCAGTSTIAYLDPHMQNPQVHEADLAIEQSLGKKTTFGVTYMLSLGRELPTAIDVNYSSTATAIVPYAIAPSSAGVIKTSYPISPTSEAASSYANYPQPPQTGAYVVLPHGGRALPLNPGQTYSTKVFLNGGRPNPNYFQILDVKSSVNSSYNALAFQINRRFDHGFSLLTNYTWSHALDENPYESTVVPTYNTLDPTNARADYGNSNTDVRQRFVAALVYQPQTRFRNILLKQALGGWRIAPVVQLQTGLPFSPTIQTSAFTTVLVQAGVAGCVPAGAATTCTRTLAGTGVNGAGSSANRVPFIARNTLFLPKKAVVDLRLGKNFYFDGIPHMDRARLEIFAEVFNLMNHQNITGVTTEAYTLTDVANVPTLTPYNAFGQYTNSNSNYTYSSRQVQIAARFHF